MDVPPFCCSSSSSSASDHHPPEEEDGSSTGSFPLRADFFFPTAEEDDAVVRMLAVDLDIASRDVRVDEDEGDVPPRFFCRFFDLCPPFLGVEATSLDWLPVLPRFIWSQNFLDWFSADACWSQFFFFSRLARSWLEVGS